MLRVDGLKRPYARKREEVKRATRSARDSQDVAEYQCTINELETKAELMQQADQIKGLQKALDEAKEKANTAETNLKKAEEDLKALQGASQENVKLKAEVERLKKDAERVQMNIKATIEAEQDRLIAENEADSDARMKIAWEALYPNKDYGLWALAFQYAENVVYLREKGEPEPESFEAWANAELEEPAKELPEEGEAIELQSDGENPKEENQAAQP